MSAPFTPEQEARFRAIVQEAFKEERRGQDRRRALAAVRRGTPAWLTDDIDDIAEFIRFHPTSELRSEPLEALLTEAFPDASPTDLEEARSRLRGWLEREAIAADRLQKARPYARS